MEKSWNINKIEKEFFEVNDSVLNEILNGKDQSKLSFLKKGILHNKYGMIEIEEIFMKNIIKKSL